MVEMYILWWSRLGFQSQPPKNALPPNGRGRGKEAQAQGPISPNLTLAFLQQKNTNYLDLCYSLQNMVLSLCKAIDVSTSLAFH